jgi:hypothetical protein
MRSICDQFQAQKDSVYFYSNEFNQRVPNFAYLKSHPRLVSSNLEDPFLNPRLFSKSEFRPLYLEAQGRIQKLFAETQAAVLKVVERKRASLSAEDFENLINRLKTVRLAMAEDKGMKAFEQDACNRPNAIYISGKHALFVCPGMMNFPDMTLQKIMAHELGHVIDPCTLSYDQSNIVGIPYQKNPLQHVVQCLQSKDSIQSYHLPYDQKHRDQHGACANVNPQDQIEEVFADWVASEVIADKIRTEQDRALSEKKALESQLLFLSVACFADQSRENLVKRSHPSIQKRIERIFLAQTAFQEAFRCQSVGVKHCE